MCKWKGEHDELGLEVLQAPMPMSNDKRDDDSTSIKSNAKNESRFSNPRFESLSASDPAVGSDKFTSTIVPGISSDPVSFVKALMMLLIENFPVMLEIVECSKWLSLLIVGSIKKFIGTREGGWGGTTHMDENPFFVSSMLYEEVAIDDAK